MAMKRVKQSEVTWVPRNKKTGKGGYLALRSDTSKPFSGLVTNIKAGTTRSSGGEAVYRSGRNVQRMKDIAAAKKGTGAAKESAASFVSKKMKDVKATPSAPATKPSGRKVNNMTVGISSSNKTYSRTSARAVERGPYRRPGMGSQFGRGSNQSIAQLEAQLKRLEMAARARKQTAAQTAAQKAAKKAEDKRIADLKAAIKKAKG